MTENASNPRKIGLTGGVGMGKSTVSRYLETAYQIPVLDADVYARAAVEPGSPILERIVNRYGPNLLQPDGTLDRRALGDIVFQQPQERHWLEQQIHPNVRDRFQQALTDLSHEPIVVLSIPLLFEANLTHLVNEIWVVYCTEAQQQQRLIHRDRLSPEQAIARIQSQMPIAEKIARADVVLDNRGDQAGLLRQIDRALARSLPSSNSMD